MDTGWKVSILPSAQRELDELVDRVRDETMQTILDLSEDPFPPGSIPLRGHPGLYRVRAYRNQYRIVYRVSEGQGRIMVERVRARPSAYRGL